MRNSNLITGELLQNAMRCIFMTIIVGRIAAQLTAHLALLVVDMNSYASGVGRGRSCGAANVRLYTEFGFIIHSTSCCYLY